MILACALAVSLQQQKGELPTELEADRVPAVQTHGDCLIRGGKVFTITKGTMAKADILVRNGKIERIAPHIDLPPGVTVIEAGGKCVLPGLIDAHSHRGEQESNEWAATAVPEVRIEDVLDPEQDGLYFAIANGITTGMLLHGSSDAIGGQSIVVKHRFKKAPEDMPFKGAPRMIKFALGENVSEKLNPNGTRFPKTRAGVESVYRRAFADAKAYMRLWDDYRDKPTGAPPRRDLRLETLADILRGKIWVQCHSYRQDEILMMVRLSQEFGFKLAAMQHALEAYKVAPELAKARVPASMFSDAWNYKVEVFDAIPMGVSICVRAGVLSSVNTDTFGGLAPLNLDAAKTMRYGVTEEEALKLVTINPAKQIGVDKWVGSLEVGKDADISIWSGHPFSVYSKCDETLIDGEIVFKRRDALKVDPYSAVKSAVTPSVLESDLQAPIPEAPCYALVGGTIDPVSSGPIPNGVLVIRDGKIAAIGGADTPIPSDARKVNVKGLLVYPGFIDGGSDVGINEVPSVPSMRDDLENGPFQPDLRFWTSINPESVKIPIARCGGVTSAFIRPNGNGLIAGQGCVVNMDGSTREEMQIAPMASLHVFFPEGLNPAFRSFLPASVVEEREKGIEVNRDAVKDYFAAAKRYALARAAGIVEADAKFEAMLPYLEGKKPVVVHANAEEAIRASLAWAKSAGIRMILAGGAESWKVTKELLDQKVPVLYSAPATSCPGENRPYGEMDPYDSNLAAPGLLQKAGIPFALQTGDSAGIMNLAWAAGELCAFGLPHGAAVRAITLGAAEILGVADTVGSLQVGKTANVIVTDGDPLEITTQLRYEFIKGRPVKLVSKFTELYRKYEKRIAARR